jgi:fumarylacetoacetate (FAA) hydrolase
MKLATYQDGSRDGQLVVVSRDLALAQYATHIANRLQQVLDDWNYLAPQLQDVYDTLNAGRGRHTFPFDPAQCMAPLPRAYQRVQAAAYAPHTAASGTGSDDANAGGAALPGAPRGCLVFQRAGDGLLGPRAPIVCASEAQALDFAAGLAVVTGDIAAGCNSDLALEGVRLLMLCNELSLQGCAAQGAGVGATALTSVLSAAFGPVAVTPDELGAAWRGGRVHLALECAWNGRTVGRCDAGSDMAWHFGQLLAAVASARAVHAGSIVGSGPVRNRGQEKSGRPHWPLGYSAITDKRAMETLLDGHPSTQYLRVSDRVRIDMKTAQGASVFGAIEQQVVAAPAASAGSAGNRRSGVQALAT